MCHITSLKTFFYTGICDKNFDDVCHADVSCDQPIIPRCEERSADDLSVSEFFNNFLLPSKPVVIRGAAKKLSYFNQWTNAFLSRQFGQKKLHLKFSPRANGTVGEFEGVEPLRMWNAGKFAIPEAVRSQLKNSDLVMVRPAGVDMKLDEFLRLVDNSNELSQNVSAYLEYTAIKDLIGRESDSEALEELPFLKGLLKLESTNVWLSDGNTLGKLHFDQYDNLLVQLSGRKQLILFEPHHNHQLYEGHIVEAMLTFRGGKFHRYKLLESTAMTMSPLDITNPNFQKFPNSRRLTPLNCTIGKGDVLFLPSWWWHEVQSYPDVEEHRNLALNYWYDPLFTKEFPCEDCPIQLNPAYRHLVTSQSQKHFWS